MLECTYRCFQVSLDVVNVADVAKNVVNVVKNVADVAVPITKQKSKIKPQIGVNNSKNRKEIQNIIMLTFCCVP